MTRSRGRRSSTICCAVHALVQRRRALIGVLEQAVPESSHAQTVARLRCFAGSTRSPLPGCAPRSATSTGSRSPRCCRGSSGSCRASTPLTRSASRARSPRPGPPHARRLLVEAAHHYRHRPARRRRRSPLARPARTPVSSRSRGAPSAACTRAGHISRATRGKPPGPSRSRARASSPRSAGRPRPWTDTPTRHHHSAPAAAGARTSNQEGRHVATHTGPRTRAMGNPATRLGGARS